MIDQARLQQTANPARQQPALQAWLWPGLLPLAATGLLLLAGIGWSIAILAVLLHAALSLILAAQRRRHDAAFGRASQVTLARSGLVVMLAATLVQPILWQQLAWHLAVLALLALLLDGLDGWLARRYGESSDFGARFDMEVDAALILVLCLGLLAADKAGAWVLAIGLMRYVFVAAARVWPWLAAPLPPSFRRKLVCVWQVAALLVCVMPLIGPVLATPILASALALLTVSFWIDVAWLRRQAHATTANHEEGP